MYGSPINFFITFRTKPVKLPHKTVNLFTFKNKFIQEQQKNCDPGHVIYGELWLISENKRGETYFIKKKGEIGRGGYEQKSIGGEQEFRVVVASHRLNLWFLIGWAIRKSPSPAREVR